MAIRGTFVLDLAQFDRTIEAAKQHLHDFEQTGKGVQASMQRLFNSFQGGRVVTEATNMAAAIAKLGKDGTVAAGLLKLTDAELRKVSASAAEATQKLTRMGVATHELPVELRQLNAELQKMNVAAAGAGNASVKGAASVGLFGGAVGTLTRYAMAYAGPLAVGAALKQTIAWGDSLSDLSQKTGISTTTLQRLNYAAERSGQSLEDMTRATQMMADRLGSGDKSAIAAIEKLGLDFERLKNQDPGETFLALGRAIGELEDPYQRAALATDLFGKSGKELIGVFLELAKTGGEDLPVMSEQAVAALGKLDDTLTDTKNASKALAGELVGTLAPALTKISESFTVGVQEAQRFGVSLSRLALMTLPGIGWLGMSGALTAPPGPRVGAPAAPPAAAPFTLYAADAVLNEFKISTKDAAKAARELAAAEKAAAAAAWDRYQQSLRMNPAIPASFAGAGMFSPLAQGFLSSPTFGGPAGTQFGGWSGLNLGEGAVARMPNPWAQFQTIFADWADLRDR